MIIFRAKEFSIRDRQEGIRRLSTYCDRVCIEIIKLIELYNNCNGNDIKHWMTEITNTFIKNVLDSEKVISPSWSKPQLSFIKAVESESTISKVLGNDFLKYCDSGFGNIYIEYLWKEILEMSQRGERKYVDAIKYNGGFLISPEDYILLFKYISLCLSGQLNYNNIDLWSDINSISRLNVNYNINTNYKINDLRKIIANCIFQFKGNIPDSGNYILEFL